MVIQFAEAHSIQTKPTYRVCDISLLAHPSVAILAATLFLLVIVCIVKARGCFTEDWLRNEDDF